ncbi:NAD(P)H-binding protein [Pseudomonas mandelii]|uniref:NAD(P)H-binding protein n=1 Tax=Pseudomonas mandelii TaxID=75612 RepID=UPI00036DD5FB|nr:NAD(P)H-binding protein [Pseudomonas mandelii]
MQGRKYLVTGATGKTGTCAIRHLLNEGHAVRAFIQQEDERSEILEDDGAEIFVGDLLDKDDVNRAMKGISGAYLYYPVRPDYVQVAAFFADAAKRASLEVVVEMSQISARENSLSHAARNHWVAERFFDWSNVPTIHLRPTFFSESLTFPWVLDQIVKENRITLPYGTGRHAPIAAEDQARLIAALLTQPSDHIGKTYSLHGPVELGYAQIAEEISSIVGRTITYSPSTMMEYRKYLQTYNLPAFVIQHFMAEAIDYQNSIFEGKDEIIREVTGTPPQTVSEFVRMNQQAFMA